MAEDINTIVEMAKARLEQNEQKTAQLQKENPRWGQDDARTQVLQRLWHVTMATLACYVAQRDHFTSGRWWKSHVGFAVHKEAGRQWNRTIDSFIKLGWIIASFSMMETGFRNLLTALDKNPPPVNFYDAYKRLLTRTDVKPTDEQRAALRLLQLTRNTIRNNGAYRGPKEEEVTFLGNSFVFTPGHQVGYAEFSTLFPMMAHVEDVILGVINSQKIRTIQSIDDSPPTTPSIRAHTVKDDT